MLRQRLQPRQLARRRPVQWGMWAILWIGLLWLGGQSARPAAAADQAIALPPGFSLQPVVSELLGPTDMVFLPNGDLLVTEKGSGFEAQGTARVRLVRQGVLQKAPLLEISTSVQVDSGLAGIAIDPNFSENGFFYLWHATGVKSPGWDGEPVNRLTRYTYSLDARTVDPASATIILDNVPWNEIHNGGGLAFDAEGNLLISTGDSAGALDPKRNNAQNPLSLGGKVLRIRPKLQGGYTIPADNPYVGMADHLPEIYAAGFRNPFRITRRATDGAFLVADVGLDTWEEVNLLQPGANYGWPAREGRCPLATSGDACTSGPAEYTDPLLAYPLPETGGAITALAFYDGTAFPQAYRNKLFFTDFNNRELFTADLDQPSAPFASFATDAGMYVDMEATPGGVYLLDIITGTISYLFYDGAGNRAPVPAMSLEPALGAAPLVVTFSAEGSYDPDDLGFYYKWDFGDGSKVVQTTDSVVQHTYEQDGNYTATLQVFDRRGGKSQVLSREVTVYSGALPSISISNQQEPGRIRFRGGDQIRFGVERSSGTTGLDPTAPFTWNLDLHHNDHTHPVVADFVSDSVTLTIPAESHALETNIWYEVRLRMQTEDGIVVRAGRELRPDLVNIQLSSWPGPIALKLNQLTQAAGTTMPVIIGQSYELEAPESIVYQDNIGVFDYWLVTDSWAAAAAAFAPGTTAPAIPTDAEILDTRVTTITPGTSAKTYVAFYRYTGPAGRQYLPLVTASSPSLPAR